MITEFAANGNLRDFLKLHRPPDSSGYECPLPGLTAPGVGSVLNYKLLASFSYQVARGMEYMAAKKVRPSASL